MSVMSVIPLWRLLCGTVADPDRGVRVLGPYIGCLHNPANVHQTSSITFAGSLLDVCGIVQTFH